MIPKLQFLDRVRDCGPFNVLILAADRRAVVHAAEVAARIETAGLSGRSRVARHLFSDVDDASDWSTIAKEAGQADVLIVSCGEEFTLPDRFRTLVEYASRMRSEDFVGVLALSDGWLSGSSRRWLANLTGPDGFEYVRTGDLDRDTDGEALAA